MAARKPGTSRANVSEVPESHNSLMETQDDLDPVMGAIRFGVESVMKVSNDTIPHFPSDNEALKKDTANRMEKCFLQLIEAEMAYSQMPSVVDQVVEEMDLPDITDVKEFGEAVESIGEKSMQRIAAYKKTLGPNIIKSHPIHAQGKKILTSLINKKNGTSQTSSQTTPVALNNADAETEEDEGNPEDSLAFEENTEEVIPELDPISKQPLKDPIRNSVCGHIYGKASMLQLIKTNPKVKCPAMGCGNLQFVRVNHLKEDPALTARVAGGSKPSKSSSAKLDHPPPSPSSQKAKRGRNRR